MKKTYKCSKILNVVINATPIPLNHTAKYPGIFFDNTLLRKQYILKLKQSYFIKINLLKRLSHTNYCSYRITLIKLYKSLMRSYFDYRFLVCAPSNSFTVDRINTTQNYNIRLALGVFLTTHTSLLCEASESPLNIRRQKLTPSSTLNILFTTNFHPKYHFNFPLHLLKPNIFTLIQLIDDSEKHILHYSIRIILSWLNIKLNVRPLLTGFHKLETNFLIFMTR